MQIAGYGMLDFHREFTDAAAKAAEEQRLHEERKRRKTACKEDGQDRFWRLLDEDEPEMTGGEWIGGYCDILGLLDEGAVEQLRTTPDLSTSLGIAGVFVVDDDPA